ncbi:hypothetical protein, partial [Kocuria palustris]|uniref:hypothetical protein n=2 Tax=Kocuria palustris TaxID=71999 RepID=UPI0019D272AB
ACSERALAGPWPLSRPGRLSPPVVVGWACACSAGLWWDWQGPGRGQGRLEPGEAGRAAHSAAGAPTAPDAPGVVTAPGVVSVGIDFEAAEHFADPADPTIAEVQAALEAREGDPLEAYRESLVLGDDVVNVEAFPGGDLDIDPLD